MFRQNFLEKFCLSDTWIMLLVSTIYEGMRFNMIISGYAVMKTSFVL